MPTFPTYLRDQSIQPPGVPQVEIGSGAVVAGMNRLAAGVGRAADAAQQYDDRLEKQSMFDDNVKLDRYRVQTENDLKEWQKNIPENATGAAQQFLATRKKANEDFLSTISPQNREHFGQLLTVDQEKVVGAAAQTEEVARNKYEVGILQTGLDKWMTTLRADPSQKDEAMKDLGTMIDHTTALSPAQRADAKKNIEANLLSAKWQALYAQDPVEGLRKLGMPLPVKYTAGAANVAPGSQTAEAVFGRMVQKESSGDPTALSPKGAQGLAQLMPGTARETAEKIGIKLPGGSDADLHKYFATPAGQLANVAIGKAYFGDMLQRYNGDVTAAVIAYNGGPLRANKWLASGRDDSVLPAETRDYKVKILGRAGDGTPQTTGSVQQAPLFVAVPKPAGMVQTGNIDLTRRPQVKNPDGSTSTVDSFSYERNDGKTVLIPSVTDEGVHFQVKNPDGTWNKAETTKAKEYWGKKAQTLGVFDTREQADDYAEKLHNQQEEFYLKGGKDRAAASGSVGPHVRANYATIQNMGDPLSPGWKQANIVPVTIAGKSFEVNKAAAPAFQGFLADLAAAGYNFKTAAGYNYRNIRGSSTLSQHSFGNAIDLNATENAQGQDKNDFGNIDVAALAAKHGLIWGGNWSGKTKDPMHFEWAGPGGVGGGGSGGAQYRTIVGGDPEYAAIPYDLRVKLADQAVRDYSTMQTEQAAALKLQQSTLQNNLQNLLIDGKAGLPDIEKAREQGWLGDADTVEKFRGIVEKREKDQADGRMFMQGLGTPGTQFNPFDATQQKGADEAFKAMGGSLKALDTIYSASGIVPKSAATMMKSGIFGTDQAAGSQTLQVASNILAKNPNAFRAVDGGTDIANAAVKFQHFLSQGKTLAEATAKVLAENDPAYKPKNVVKDEDLKTFTDGITAASVGKMFDQSNLPFTDPRVGANSDQMTGIIAEFREVATDFYKQSGDPKLALAQTKAQLEKVYGVTKVLGQDTLTKYPPEKAYPPVGGSYDYIVRQAEQEVAKVIGRHILPSDVGLFQAPQTERDFLAGKPVPYQVVYYDTKNGQRTMEILPGGLFVADPGAAQKEAQAVIEPQLRAKQGTVLQTEDYFTKAQQDADQRARMNTAPTPQGAAQVPVPAPRPIVPPPPTEVSSKKEIQKQMQDLRQNDDNEPSPGTFGAY